MTFSDEIRINLIKATNGFCQNPNCNNKGNEFHHIKPNTKLNQKKYPLFLQSPFNACILCKACHDNYSCFKWLRINDNVAQFYEKYLQELKNGRLL